MKSILLLTALLISNVSFAADSKIICVTKPYNQSDYDKALTEAVAEINLKLGSQAYNSVSAPSIAFTASGSTVVCVTVTK